jgi:two-component system, cell cycle sensor histidine kinase and response regulator CckA
VRTRQSFGQVLLEVRDRGIGMDEATKARIFEPFFTTKADEGTGIGLATVHMIVERAGGSISVESSPGVGTTFRIFLPLCGDSPELNDSILLEPEKTVTEKKVILLAEDEPAVQLLERRILESNHFEVIVASSGEEALSILDRHAGPIDLLMTDVVMPGINGRELAEEVERRRPGISVLFLSGYTPDEVLRQGVESDQANFLQKPFSPSGLLAKVKDVLSQVPV